MSAYYNEIDPYPAQWLRNLISAGHIARGDVDNRSIEDVRPDDVMGATQAHFFAGLGGWSYALRLAGWPDDRPVWTASCPCQPFSVAGDGGGSGDARHLWPVLAGLIAECGPATIFGEQVASEDGRLWLAAVRADLEVVGYQVGAADLCAAGVGAPHVRQRLFWVARRVGDADDSGSQGHGRFVHVNEAGGRSGSVRYGATSDVWRPDRWASCLDGSRRPVGPGPLALADGIPARVGRLRAYGNAIVPQVAAQFIMACMDVL